MIISILIGDCREKLRELPDQSVHCCVTSPPYFGLRDYGVEGQMGLEPTPDEFVAGMVEVFREVKRVLRPDGTVFLNIGDSYASGSVLSQSYSLREDLTDDQRTAAAVAMFGVCFDEHLEAGEGSLSEVLPSAVHSPAVCDQPPLAGGRIEGDLSSEQGNHPAADGRTAPGDEMGSAEGAGREVCLLRGDSAGVPDGRSHKRRRCGTSEAAGRNGEDLSGCAPVGLSQGSVSRSVLQLQLRARLVRILSSRTYEDDEIPAEARPYFQRAGGLKPKDLIGIPWRLAFALQADGWTLRQDIIWAKCNPMPESVRDRCTKSHEYLFLLSKGPRYFYDAAAIAEPLESSSIARLSQDIEAQEGSERVPGKTNGKMKAVYTKPYTGQSTKDYASGKAQDASETKRRIVDRILSGELVTRNKRSVWEVATQPYSEAHFATYPPALIEPCILAGCPKGGTVLDPFGGAGTTALVADRLGRNAILIELNPEYAAIAERRLTADGGIFAEVKAA